MSDEKKLWRLDLATTRPEGVFATAFDASEIELVKQAAISTVANEGILPDEILSACVLDEHGARLQDWTAQAKDWANAAHVGNRVAVTRAMKGVASVYARKHARGSFCATNDRGEVNNDDA